MFLTFTSFLFFGLASMGLTAILVDGKVFLPWREWLAARRDENCVARFFSNIFACYQCCGFWSGIICGAFFQMVDVLYLTQFAQIKERYFMVFSPELFYTAYSVYIVGNVFCCGLVGSILALSYLIVVEFIHSHTLRPPMPPTQNEINDEHE